MSLSEPREGTPEAKSFKKNNQAENMPLPDSDEESADENGQAESELRELKAHLERLQVTVRNLEAESAAKQGLASKKKNEKSVSIKQLDLKDEKNAAKLEPSAGIAIKLEVLIGKVCKVLKNDRRRLPSNNGRKALRRWRVFEAGTRSYWPSNKPTRRCKISYISHFIWHSQRRILPCHHCDGGFKLKLSD